MKKVAVCGCGLRYYERMELFDQIKRITPAHDISLEKFTFATIMHLIISHNQEQIDIATFQGSVLRSSTFYPKLLHNADVIVYIISGMLPKSEDSKHVRSVDIEQQIFDFQQYIKAASQAGVLQDDVSWIWVLTEDLFGSYVANKIEMVFENPLLGTLKGKDLPEQIKLSFWDDIIICHMAIGKGVDTLLERIISNVYT